jgi:MoxR-like ATPase
VAGIEQAQNVEPGTPMERVLFEMKKVIVGQEYLLERVMVALLARGHVLIEGVPGLAKTLTIRTLAETISGEFKRIQFTPDLVPADLVGTRVYNQGRGEFTTELGPVFTNLLLADEINRAPAKVQSALLEVMQERQVTIGHESHSVPNPFLVLATQNPIETEGTYALPEAQVDRFLLKILVGYPNEQEELTIVQRMTGAAVHARPILTTTDLLGLQAQTDAVYVDPEIMAYAVRLVSATRKPAEFGLPEIARYLAFGASPRASINLVLSARALALLRGRDYVLPGDVADLAPDVLRHRLVLTYEAFSDGVTPDKLVASVLGKVARPARPLQGPADSNQTWSRHYAHAS